MQSHFLAVFKISIYSSGNGSNASMCLGRIQILITLYSTTHGALLLRSIVCLII